MRENNFILKTRYAIGCIVNFYNTGNVGQDFWIGSWTQSYKFWVYNADFVLG
jgi:hypothetical protein